MTKTAPLAALMLASTAFGQAPPGEAPALGSNRITQAGIENGDFTLQQIRRKGLEIFSTPFNKLDGFGDGPQDPFNPDKTSPGNRPTLGDNGTFMRMNGLDAQACVECHSLLSTRTIPPVFGVGGVGGVSQVAMPGPTEVDIDDDLNNGFAAYNGRLINPPFIFGSGGVELLAKEMTIELQVLKNAAQLIPDTPMPLVTKGVDFGTIVFDSGLGDYDTSGVVGVDSNLVVQPFGRKGNNQSIREFDIGALQFHQGMQPEEVVDDMDGDGAADVGVDNDVDGDGVFNEIRPGELTALHIFSVSSDRPRGKRNQSPSEFAGQGLFTSIGCASCHVPTMITNSRVLPIAYPEVDTNPLANVIYTIDLTDGPAKFRSVPGAGVKVDLFSDLKRHDMGSGLAEKTPDTAANPFFVTPRLWGVADTAPYLHDGRAATLTEAIEDHGGEGALASGNFVSLPPSQKQDLLAYLRTLRSPLNPNADLANILFDPGVSLPLE